MGKDKGPLDTETTIDLELVSEKSLDHWLKLLKQWDGVRKLSKLDKVLLLETFFTVCFDPFRLDTFIGLDEKVIECEDGGDDEPGCGAEFYSDLPRCPFCTNSESDDPKQKSEKELAEYLLMVHDTKVSAPKKAPPSPISPKVEEKPIAQPLVKVERAEVTPIEPQTNLTVATVEELDAAVSRIVTTYKAAATNAYECAVELKETHDRKLWLQRRDKDGKPLYKVFNDFVRGELEPQGITRVRAFGLIDMATKFSREEFNKLGPAKMTVLVSMEPEARQQLVQETIENELPLREVRERKSETRAASNVGSGGSGRGIGGNSSRESKAAKPTPEIERSFTMVFPGAEFKLEFTAQASGRKKGKPATLIDDLPVALVSGVNGVQLRINLKHGKGGQIVGECTLTREE